MNDKEIIEFLESAIQKLNEFSTSLDINNLKSFDNFKKQIMEVLIENDKIRFNQIEFYEDLGNFNQITDDDVPF